MYSDAVSISGKLKDPENKLRGQVKLTQLLFYSGKHNAAENKLITCISIAKKYKDKTILAEALRTMGVVLIFTERFEQGGVYFKQSLNIFMKKKHLLKLELDEKIYTPAFKEGRKLKMKEALEYGLE